MQINASNMSINTDSAVFKVLNSLGLTVNSNNILTLDTSGNTTLGHHSNVTMLNSSLCLFNTSVLSLNTIFDANVASAIAAARSSPVSTILLRNNIAYGSVTCWFILVSYAGVVPSGSLKS